MAINLSYMRRRMQLGAQPHKAKASGAVATFRTNLAARLDSLFVDVTPVQDLHGQQYPYPAGGGKNKFDPNSTENEWVNLQNQLITITGGKSNRIACSENTVVTISNKNPADSNSNYMLIAFLDENNDVLFRKAYTLSGKYISATAPANTTQTLVAFYTWASSDEQMVEFGTSTPTAYAPYSNVCPITGWAAAKVTGCGVNLISNAGTDWETGGINSSGQNSTANNQKRTIGYFPVKGGSTMKLSGIPAQSPTNNVRLFYYAADGTFIDYYNYRETFSVPAKAASFRMRTPQDLDLSALQLEYDTASAYTPYVGTTAVVQFGQTLYGARIDWNGRKAVVDTRLVDLASLTWSTRYTGTNKKTLSATLPANYYGYTDISPFVMAEEYVSVRGIAGISALSNPDNLDVGLRWYRYQNTPYTSTMYCVLDKNSTPNGKMVYKLAEPFEIPLDLVDFVTVPGINNVFADCGNVDLSYWTN